MSKPAITVEGFHQDIKDALVLLGVLDTQADAALERAVAAHVGNLADGADASGLAKWVYGMCPFFFGKPSTYTTILPVITVAPAQSATVPNADEAFTAPSAAPEVAPQAVVIPTTPTPEVPIPAEVVVDPSPTEPETPADVVTSPTPE